MVARLEHLVAKAAHAVAGVSGVILAGFGAYIMLVGGPPGWVIGGVVLAGGLFLAGHEMLAYGESGDNLDTAMRMAAILCRCP